MAAPLATVATEFLTPAIEAPALAARQATADPYLVVDVRGSAEYKSGHVAGAINLPHDKLERHLDELRGTQYGVVLYCSLGKRTRLAERTLLDHEVPNVFHLEGGLTAWRRSGQAIHTGWGP